ncbi:MAG: hypothetical protein IT426_13705 [Pirellulales bacterium]|nr:hypothetical protein [Pirellulales bacterium]
MESVFPYVLDFNPVWTPLAEEIHRIVWDDVGLPTVQGFVRQWAESYNREVKCRKRIREEVVTHWAESLELSEVDCIHLIPKAFSSSYDPSWPELPLPPGHRLLSPEEKWSCLAAIHDAYRIDGDKINPWPEPPDEPLRSPTDRADIGPFKAWLFDGGWDFRMLLQRAANLADTAEPVVSRWLLEVTAAAKATVDFVPSVTWQDAAEQLKRLYERGEPWTSYRKLANLFSCSTQTLHKAIQETPSLQIWAKKSDKTIPRAQSINPVITDRVAQNRELNPEDEAAIREFIEKADPETKAWFLSLSTEKQLEVVTDLDTHLTDNGPTLNQRILGRKA